MGWMGNLSSGWYRLVRVRVGGGVGGWKRGEYSE